MPDPDARQRPLSSILTELSERPDSHLTIAELTQQFGGRAMGALLLFFGLCCILPLPPGATTIFGLPLLMLSVQLTAGAAAPWLPRKLRRRRMATADLRSGLPRVMPWLRRAEAVSRPRLPVLFGRVGERLIGLVITVLALVLILPIPLGNMLPALAVSVLSFSLIQRDGAFALLGYGLAAASGTVLVLAAHIIVSMFRGAWAFFGAA